MGSTNMKHCMICNVTCNKRNVKLMGYVLTMMQIKHYHHFTDLLCCIPFFINKNMLDMKPPQGIPFLTYISHHYFRHVYQLAKIVKNTTSHDNFPTFINFAIEIFQNTMPSIFQISKTILNEHMTMIH